MKLYLFKRIEQLSDSWHQEGGLVIVANDLEHAKSLIANEEYIKPTDAEWVEAIVYPLDTSNDSDPHIWPVVYTFPDAGCC